MENETKKCEFVTCVCMYLCVYVGDRKITKYRIDRRLCRHHLKSKNTEKTWWKESQATKPETNKQ